MTNASDWLAALMLIVGMHLILIAVPLYVWFSHQLDRTRVANFIDSRGGKLLSMTWTLDNAEMLFDSNARVYIVRYVDKEGQTQQAICRTTWPAGVHLSREVYLDETSERPRVG